MIAILLEEKILFDNVICLRIFKKRRGQKYLVYTDTKPLERSMQNCEPTFEVSAQMKKNSSLVAENYYTNSINKEDLSMGTEKTDTHF